ncbi:MAG: GntR family transcriptional regulator [Lachnospiraceae bacterium]|nr:GntR family transcriptional regulator [Lachnospiraceae bacterium]
MEPKTTKKKGTSDIVYKSLKNEILHLQLLPGSAVSEIETSNKYNVSRTPVRDAFKALASEGLLEVVPHVGTFVSYIDIREISDILFLREVVEQAVLRILANTYTQAQVLKIRLALNEQQKLIQQMSTLTPEEQKEAGTRFLLLDNQFHELLFSLAGKKKIWDMLVNSNPQYERFRALLNVGNPEAMTHLYEAHCEIVETILQRNLEKLQQVVTNHLYGGFSENADIVLKNADYFTQETEDE